MEENENIMKIIHYTSIEPSHFDNDQAKGVSGRVVIGKNDDANHFCMRVFEVRQGGHTPRHSHAWEHEIFIHAGEGEAYGQGKWHSFQPGSVIFIPADEEHQIRNAGKDILIFACLIPSGIPEL
jgi:quercetin dioxygenase-like cupin family protein